ncbi:MAG: sn-glycerol-3-phosphate ABC transporter ATP-binding protein UgpC [Pirellulales bacterium]
MADVRLLDVCKVYQGGVPAVDRASLHVRDGEFLVLVGPSGCGKSTLLRMIAGLEEISSGEILIGDRRVNEVEPGDRDIAMVFQNYALYPHMTVAENLSFGLKMRRLPAAEIQRRVEEVARILSIEPLLARQPRALSGGQRQRVALGRAIVRQPQVFLFDEPLSNLDAKLRVQMRTEIARLHQRLKTTMIYVTHDQVEAMTLGDRIVIINRGVIQQVDSPMNLYLRPANRFVAGFIGSPAMNFLDGTVRGGEFHSVGRTFPIASPAADGRAVLGIRPEHLNLNHGGACLAEGTVDVVERMGHETIIYVDSAGQKLVARTEPAVEAAPGQHVRLSASPNDAHLFAADGDQVRLN